MSDLPIAPIGRILTNAGVPRATKDAKIQLSKFLVEVGEGIAEEAVAIAENSGRKTIKSSDIELAVKMRLD